MTQYAVDYDLAILGGSYSSRLAASIAAQRGARVALIAPTWNDSDRSNHLLRLLSDSSLDSLLSTGISLRDWGQYERPDSTPAALRLQGIDVILEPARFTQDRTLQLANRSLNASRYLLTDGYGVAAIAKTPESLPCHQLSQLKAIPPKLTVVGRGASAVEWAYGLSRIATVSLTVLDRVLLPAEDIDIQRLVAAQFRSLGISVSAMGSKAGIVLEPLQDHLWVTVPDAFNWDASRLDNIGITDSPIAVNSYLQSSYPRVYVSGSSLGGENRAELTQQETTVALNNALFDRHQPMRYEQAFYSINLLSPVGRWGLTERQARERYGADVQIFQASYLPDMAVHASETNFCKLISQGSRILGVHLMGPGAPEFVASLGHWPTLDALHQQIGASVKPKTLSQAIYQAIEQYQTSRWCEGQWRRDWAENWFNFRRSTG
ncbi:MAG: NAD-binding protein [Leptolyngbyaceae cyanobacterium]